MINEIKCSCCGKVISGKETEPHPDPYDSEINDNHTLIVQCEACEEASGEQI